MPPVVEGKKLACPTASSKFDLTRVRGCHNLCGVVHLADILRSHVNECFDNLSEDL
jgi:hypothetical protein